MPWLVGACLLLGGAALAKKPTEFQAPQQMSEEDIAAAKARSKNPLNGFDEKMEEQPTCMPWGGPAKCKPFPWMAVGLAFLSFLVAAPFGLRAFKTTSREISGADSSLGPNRSQAE
ncbi:MAG: hypothetical protein JNK82_22315 [Myxococcaceae bacterium]|nr:hypothetical protein [Myxococcaceae bacterium]